MSTETATGLIIPNRVEARVMNKVQCRDDPDLRAMTVTDSPAAEEVQAIKGNLVSGQAVPQTVVILKEETSTEVLSMISIRLDGRLDLIMAPPGMVPEFMRKLAVSPYINVLGRDDHYKGAVLLDGETHLGVVTIRAGIELASRITGEAPEMWATVKKTNGASKRAFKALGFHRHSGSDRIPDGDVLFRRAGLPLPPAPPRAAYRPLNPTQGPQHEFPLAA